MDELAADVEFLLPLHEGGLGDVGVAETLLIALRVLLHGSLECLGDADVIDDETTFFAGEDAIDACNGLHEVVAAHGLIDVHGGERRHIEAREPHVAHDGNLHRVVVVLELLRQLLLVVVVADDLLPVLGVLVARRHHDLHLVGPRGAQFEYLAVDLDGDAACQRHDHRLAREFLGAVLLVVADDVLDERGDGLVVAEDAFEACQLVLGLGKLFVGGTFVGEVVKLLVEQLEHLLVEFEVEHAALVIDGTCGAILDGLCHVVDVDVVAEDLLRVAVAIGKWGAREADERGVG